MNQNTQNKNINQTKIMELQELAETDGCNKDCSFTTFVKSLLFNMADHEMDKTFRLCLVQEQLEFQEALAKVVSII